MSTLATRPAPLGDAEHATATPRQKGPTPGKTLLVTLVLRRNHGAAAAAHAADIAAPLQAEPKPLNSYALAARQNAVQTAITTVTNFVTSHGMTVVEADAARRKVVVTGTVAQMSAAFAVDHSLPRSRPSHPGHSAYAPDSSARAHHGGDGFSVTVPAELTGVVQGFLMDFEWVRRVRAQLRSQRRSAGPAAELDAV